MVNITSPDGTASSEKPVSKPGRRVILAGMTAASVGLLSACSPQSGSSGGASGASSPSSGQASATASTPPKPEVTTQPAAHAAAVNPATLPSVTVKNGTLSKVTLADAAGAAVPGKLSADKTSWEATGRLKFDAAYSLVYTVAGKPAETVVFSTVGTAHQADARQYPPDGSVVGIAQPIQILFSEPVVNQKAVEKAITITASSGQKGRFYWMSDKEVRYRPEKFWEPYTTVKISYRLFGVDLGKGMIGNFDLDTSFSTHNVRHAIVSDKDLTLRCYIDGKLVETFPTTLGTKKWPSADGIFPIMTQARSERFAAESIGLKPGDESYYEAFDYEWTSRLTLSGVYVHAVKPEALPYLGRDHISHGCVGLPWEGAKWIVENFDPGDIIEVKDTGNGLASIDKGWMDFNIPWSEYGTDPKHGGASA